MRRRWAAIAVALAVLAAAGLWLVFWLEGVDRGRYAHLATPERIAGLNRAFAEMGDDVVLFGDSHSEFIGDPSPLCGRSVINAGVGGVSARGYLNLLVELRMPRRAKAGLLSIGVNSARKKLLPRSRSDFRDNASDLIAALQQRTQRLVVTALPPVGAEAARLYDLDALKAYSEELDGICRTAGCRFLDPFADIRSENPVIARPGSTRDGVHLVDYRAPLAKSATLLCD
ncbi:MAG: SGNH/GDSL hydrolase family protein [Beijerinckiaceae bacterium]|nr:SGNH/GDSL hydrolase family protein [Beijerinckiaceae bacterium]